MPGLEHIRKVKLGRYPYTYVRTSVMKSLLFKREDYQKMLKMEFSEIAKHMQDSNYKKEINELAAEHSGAELLEIALNRNLANSYKKLLKMSPDGLGLLVREYIKRKDIEDLKTVLRGKLTNASEKEISNSITGAGIFSHDFFMSLLKKGSIEEMLKSNRLIDFSAFAEGLRELKEKHNLVAIENEMDRHYYSSLMKFSRIMPKEGELFRNFLVREVYILNILTLLRLKKAKFTKDRIKSFIINSGSASSKISELSALDSFEDIAKYLENTEYRKSIESGLEELKKNGSLIKIETGLYKHLLRQSILMLHQHPLSVNVILGYMLAKEIETRNLKIIIKGKQLKLKEDFIENQLVF